jgi:hypothetical protein
VYYTIEGAISCQLSAFSFCPKQSTINNPQSAISGGWVSRRTGIALVILGLAIVVLSLAALAYAFWPVNSLTQQAPLVPTLFVSP